MFSGTSARLRRLKLGFGPGRDMAFDRRHVDLGARAILDSVQLALSEHVPYGAFTRIGEARCLGDRHQEGLELRLVVVVHRDASVRFSPNEDVAWWRALEKRR